MCRLSQLNQVPHRAAPKQGMSLTHTYETDSKSGSKSELVRVEEGDKDHRTKLTVSWGSFTVGWPLPQMAFV